MANGSVRRRRGPRVLLIGFAVMVILAVVGVVVIRWMWQPDSASYASVRDTAGSAKGQAGKLTEALRSRGLTCSNQYLDERAGFSRGCYRTDFEHDVEVEFAGPPDGTLGRVSISVDYIGADDEENAHVDFDALVGDVVRTAALGSADAATLKKHLRRCGSATTRGWRADGRTSWGCTLTSRSSTSGRCTPSSSS